MFTIENEPLEAAQAREKILTSFADLEFQEEGHIYTLHGKTLRSASAIGELFCRRPFDAKMVSEKYAEKHPEHSAEGWQREWALNSFRATTLGTKTHAFGESLGYLLDGHPELIVDLVRPQYHEQYKALVPIHPKEEAVVKFFNDLPKSYHLVLNEARVYSGKNPDESKNLKEQVCGTFDMLYYYDGDGNAQKSGFIIMDYKTNEKLTSENSRKWGNVLLAPFHDYFEESLSYYTIQLSLYALMLEDIGLNVIDRKIIWLKGDGTYEKSSLADVSDRLRALDGFPQERS